MGEGRIVEVVVEASPGEPGGGDLREEPDMVTDARGFDFEVEFGHASLRAFESAFRPVAVQEQRRAPDHGNNRLLRGDVAEDCIEDLAHFPRGEVGIAADSADYEFSAALVDAPVDQPWPVAELQAGGGERSSSSSELSLKPQRDRFVGNPERCEANEDHIRVVLIEPAVEDPGKRRCGPHRLDDCFDGFAERLSDDAFGYCRRAQLGQDTGVDVAAIREAKDFHSAENRLFESKMPGRGPASCHMIVRMDRELIFMVTEEPDGGYSARAVGESIVTEADDMPTLREKVADAVATHFAEGDGPTVIRLHMVKH